MKTLLCSKMVALVALSVAMVQAVEDIPMQVTDVAVFKNGYSQLSLRGQINGSDTQLRLLGMPVPVLGSFWWTAPDGSTVCEIRSESATQQVPKTHYNTIEFLLANVGAQAEIVLQNGTKLTGVICAPPSVKSSSSFTRCTYSAPQKSGYGSPFSLAPDSEHVPASAASTVVQLRTANGVASLREQNIAYAEVLGDSPQYPTTVQKVPALVFELSAPAAGKSLQVSGLSRGLSWLPSYRLDLDGHGKARFQCKAMVMNELVDLNDVNLELVMGYPALGNYLLPSPIALYHSLEAFLNLISGEPNDNRSRLSTNITSNINMGYVAEQEREPGNLTQAEDLFFYSIPNFCCAAGQTVTRELFEGTVDYSHVYTWHVPTQSAIEDWQRRQQGGYSRNSVAPNEVWHCVRVRNELKSPWTTGVLDCYAEGHLVGRSEINFTAEGGTALVRLNKTMQAPVQYSETLQSRVGEELFLNGSLSITNNSDKEMLVCITKDVDGTPKSASDHATITCTPDYGENPDGQFRWEVVVPPGATKTVTYQYTHKN